MNTRNFDREIININKYLFTLMFCFVVIHWLWNGLLCILSGVSMEIDSKWIDNFVLIKMNPSLRDTNAHNIHFACMDSIEQQSICK